MHDTLPISTTEIAFPWSKPEPTTARYLTPRARLRRRRNRFMQSAFMDDLRAGYRRSLTILGAFAVAYACLVVIRGLWFSLLLIGAAR